MHGPRGIADLRRFVRAALIPVRIGGWIFATICLGAAALARAASWGFKIRRSLADVAICPRGHETPCHGVYECAQCGAVVEGWVFSECAVCGQSAGWTPCVVCGLPVINPLR
jgi:hypothetical protein